MVTPRSCAGVRPVTLAEEEFHRLRLRLDAQSEVPELACRILDCTQQRAADSLTLPVGEDIEAVQERRHESEWAHFAWCFINLYMLPDAGAGLACPVAALERT